MDTSNCKHCGRPITLMPESDGESRWLDNGPDVVNADLCDATDVYGHHEPQPEGTPVEVTLSVPLQITVTGTEVTFQVVVEDIPADLEDDEGVDESIAGLIESALAKFRTTTTHQA